MCPVLSFLDAHSGALTFLVTLIYAITTYFILRANKRAADASFAQIEESKRQFGETKRLECMPFLQLEIPVERVSPLFEIELPMYKKTPEDSIYKILTLKNLGNGTATNIVYSWVYKDLNVADAGYPPINAIMRGDQYCFQLTAFAEKISNNTRGILTFQYDDLLGNTYEQKVVLCFEESDLARCENNPPCYLGKLRYKLAGQKEDKPHA